MSFVELENVRKTYGSIIAVEDVDLKIEEGEFLAILGPSGSGKTTTLNLIAGFEEMTSGDIRVDSKTMSGVPPEGRHMGMVFQDLALFPHMNVFENIAFGLRMRDGFEEQTIEEKVRSVLKTVELGGMEERPIQELSGGQQQRVALARAIVIEPQVLLFDEPLSDLDRKLRETLRREISLLHNELGITSIYVTHNQREALTLGDRVAVMHDGSIAQVGKPSELYNNPSNRFVADFVGDSNIFSGEIIEIDGQKVFSTESFQFPVSTARNPGDTCSLVVRPEEVRLSKKDAPDPSFLANVDSITYLGSSTEYHVKLKSKRNDQEILALELGSPRFNLGEEVRVIFDDYVEIDS